MDQLELLKKDWKKQEAALPMLTYDELSKIIHKKSSSIVKWIFIISVLEFLIPHVVYLFMDNDKVTRELKNLGLQNFSLIINILFYTIVLVFIYLFYKNYKSISANSNPKILMLNIIRTRKTVKYYIWFSLSMIPVIGGIFLYKSLNSADFLENIPEETNMTIVWLIAVLLICVLVAIFWLIYRVIYGILLNKLMANYNELVDNGNGNL